MCAPGNTVNVYVNDKHREVPVDSCIADEIRALNELGVITLGSCCGHEQAGRIVTYDNAYGRWKEHTQPPHVLIAENSVQLMRELGYRPYPYYYADGSYDGVWQAQLMTGDIMIEEGDCK